MQREAELQRFLEQQSTIKQTKSESINKSECEQDLKRSVSRFDEQPTLIVNMPPNFRESTVSEKIEQIWD